MERRYLKDPKATQEDLKTRGIYTVYKDNVLQSSTVVMVNTSASVVQIQFDEANNQGWRRREWNGTKWSDWTPWQTIA